MKRERWQRIEEILDSLLDLPPDERRDRLDDLTNDDHALRKEILPFLADDGTNPGLLDEPLDAYAAAVIDDVPAAETIAGNDVGPYRILEAIGEGGMGTVYLAERTDGEFEHRVALKLVRGGRPDILDRFRHERQILARLRHPNIAVLLDGGVTDDGQPYFAMEYIEGKRINDYCDERNLGVDARLRLFQDVCRAVHYAHRNLVIHRDLKPSNVLITDDGVVKLLDFGIAKIVDDDDGGATTTRHFLTPAYAAPEQVLAEPTSTSTDIYSLGVLLYELLTGRNPHGDTSRSAQLVRAVAAGDPPTASTAVDAETATTRSADAQTIRRRLQGDLDTILSKALRKAAEDRYASAEDLRADIDRHQNKRPIAARKPTLRYRLSRFAARNRVGAAAIVATAIALVGGMIGIAWQANVAADERDRARAQAERAEAAQTFLMDVFSAADPAYEPGDALTAVELAERGADRIETAFADQPGVRADVTQMLGTVFLRLGQYERADTLLVTALELHESSGNDAAAIETLVEHGTVLQWLQRLEESKGRFNEVLERSRAEFGADHDFAIKANMGLGTVAFHQGDFAAAESILVAGLERTRRVKGEIHATTSEHYSSLGTVRQAAGNRRESADAAAKALEIERALNPDGGVSLARALASYADILDDIDRREEAEKVALEALEIYAREYGEEGHAEVAMTHSNLAGALRGLERFDEAIHHNRKAVDIFLARLGRGHPFVARAYNNLAVTLKRSGDFEGAVEAYRNAIDLGRESFGPRHPALLPFLSNYASTLSDLGDLETAERMYKEAISIAEESGTNDFGNTYALLGLGMVYRQLGRLEEAESLARQAWEIRKRVVGKGHSAELHTRLTIASLKGERGDLEAARTILLTAIEDSRAGLPDTRIPLDKALEESAIVSRDMGDREAEVEYLKQLIELRKETMPPDDPRITRLEASVREHAGS